MQIYFKKYLQKFLTKYLDANFLLLMFVVSNDNNMGNYKQEFNEHASKRPYINTSHELVGKTAFFMSGINRNIPVEKEVLGVEENAGGVFIYVNWDCYWVDLNIKKRKIKFK